MTFQPNEPRDLGRLQPAGIQGVSTPAPATVAVQGAFLTQSFFWMFAGLLLTAGIAAFAQFNDALVAFGSRNFVLLIIG